MSIWIAVNSGDSGELEIMLPPGKYAVISKGVIRELKGGKIATNNLKRQ